MSTIQNTTATKLEAARQGWQQAAQAAGAETNVIDGVKITRIDVKPDATLTPENRAAINEIESSALEAIASQPWPEAGAPVLRPAVLRPLTGAE